MSNSEGRYARALVIAATLVLALPAAGAQDLAARMPRDGRVSFTTEAREGVCGDGRQSIGVGRNTFYGTWNDRDWREHACRPGPLRVLATLAGGEVETLRATVGPVAAGADSVADLGTVSPDAARAWLLRVARRGDGRVSERALLPLVLVQGEVPWRDLLAIARDESTRPRGTRRQAAHWLARLASAKLSGHPGDVTWSDEGAETPEQEVQKQAVFALSQHKGGAIEPLLTVARTHRDPVVRRQALFWLGESGDARALALFEEILSR